MKEGKFLEMLVECLEKLLAADGITVTPNQKFYKDGVQVGEVDIVLSGRFGSSNIMVGIECRHRQPPQDRNWIRTIMGKRDDLWEFGFRHWIAVSASGFRPTARNLAEKEGIDLRVPGEMRPLDPDKYGPHTPLKFGIISSSWRPDEVSCMIEHDSEAELAKIQTWIAKDSWRIVSLNEPGKEPTPMYEFLESKVEAYFQEHELAAGYRDFTKTHVFEAAYLQGVVKGIPFGIHAFKAEVTVCQETIRSDFRMMAFAAPIPKGAILGTRDILGIIGINEYRHNGTTTYVMTAMKPDDVDNIILVRRDAEGNPIEGEMVFLQSSYPPGTSLRNIRLRVKP
jgi:hypothetical protein